MLVPPAPARYSPLERWRTRTIPILGTALVSLVCFFLLDGFHESLLALPVGFEHIVDPRYFDFQGYGLVHGRLDVPCPVLGWEAYDIHGRCYGYWGLTPALFRLLLNALAFPLFGHWSRLLMLAAALCFFAGARSIARTAFADMDDGPRKQAWITGFALLVCLGGPLTFIVTEPSVYHESIAWAAAFALLAYAATIESDRAGNRRTLYWSVAAAFLALNSRETVGLGAAIAVGAMAIGPWIGFWPRLVALLPAGTAAFSRRTAATVLALTAIATLSPVAVNLLKFGQLGRPLQNEVFYYMNPARLDRVKLGTFRVQNLPCDAAQYLAPGTIAIEARFPWIDPAQPKWWEAGRPFPPGVPASCADANIDLIDATISIVDGAPGPLVLALVGIVMMARRWRSIGRRWMPAAIGGVVGCGFLLFYTSISYRYVLDFLPMLAVAGAPGWRRVAAIGNAPTRMIAILGLVMLTGWGLLANFAMANISGLPQPYMKVLTRDVTGWLGVSPP